MVILGLYGDKEKKMETATYHLGWWALSEGLILGFEVLGFSVWGLRG